MLAQYRQRIGVLVNRDGAGTNPRAIEFGAARLWAQSVCMCGRKMFWGDGLISGQGCGAPEHVFELANVAGPRARPQCTQCGFVDRQIRQAPCSCDRSEEHTSELQSRG